MEKTNKEILKNGITFIHRQTKPLPIVSIRMFIKVGSINETEQNTGITHLTQVMLLKGTKSRTSQQIADEIESLGGSIGTDSSEDYSEITVSITNRHLNKALQIISDIFLNPVFPEDELIKERMITLAAIKSRKDHIFNIANDLLIKNLYGEQHPYSRINIGTEASISTLKRDDIVNWHKKFYGNSNIILVIVGNVSFSKTKALILKNFKEIPIVSSTEQKFQKPHIDQPKTIVEKTNFEQAYLMYGFIGPSVLEKDYCAMKVLDAYLGGGMSSKLFQELREKAGLGYEVDSFFPSRKEHSRFVMYLGLDKSSLEIAKEKIINISNELKTNTIDEKKLNEVKQYIKGVYLLDHQTSSRQAWYLGWYETINKGWQYDEKFILEIDKVNPDDLQRLANLYISSNPVIVQLLPQEENISNEQPDYK